MSTHVVLVGRALGAPTAEQTLADLADRLGRRLGSPVHTALLDHGECSVHQALDECRDAGAADVVLLPVQVPRDRYLETWLRKAIAHWAADRSFPDDADRRPEPAPHSQPAPSSNRATPPPHSPRVRVAAGVSETGEVIDALAAAVAGPARPVTESPEAFRSPNWSEITAHRHHVLVCRGPRCSAYGSSRVAKALAADLRARDQDDDAVLVTQTGCLVPCNLGPIVVVHPDDVWYTGVGPDTVRRIVDDHLCAGKIVDELHTTRPAAAPTSSAADHAEHALPVPVTPHPEDI